MKLTIKSSLMITRAVPAKNLVNLFISACEGGSNYWCDKLTPRGKHGDHYEAMLGGFTVWDKETPDEKGRSKRIDVKGSDIIEGVHIFAEKYPKHFADMMSEDFDATTGDVFLQCCVFKECPYG